MEELNKKEKELLHDLLMERLGELAYAGRKAEDEGIPIVLGIMRKTNVVEEDEIRRIEQVPREDF